MSFWEEYTKLRITLKNSINLARYEHTLSVVRCIKTLADIYELDVEKATIAALLHDCGREIKNDKSVTFADENGIKIDNVERVLPILIHAKIGAYLAKKKYGIIDKEVLSAIKYHTTGSKNMGKVAMALYIADMLEENREFDGVKQLRDKIGKVGLEELMFACLNSSIGYLLKTRLPIHKDSIKTYNSLAFLLLRSGS